MKRWKYPLLRFYLVLLALGLGFLAFNFFYINRVPFAEPAVDSLSQLQDKQLETFFEMNKLLITLATLTLGGMGAFVFERYKTGQLPLHQIWRAVASWIFAGLSLCNGYLTYETVIWMLQNKFFNLSNPHVLWLSRAQFWTFLISVFFFAEFAFRGLQKE